MLEIIVSNTSLPPCRIYNSTHSVVSIQRPTRAQFHKACQHKNSLSTRQYCLAETAQITLSLLWQYFLLNSFMKLGPFVVFLYLYIDVSWRRAEYTVRNVKNKLALYRANPTSTKYQLLCFYFCTLFSPEDEQSTPFEMSRPNWLFTEPTLP